MTLATTDMARAVEFYEAIGLRVLYGGTGSDFTSFSVGDGFLNLQSAPGAPGSGQVWGRVIIWVEDVDAMFDRVREAGFEPEAPPMDAPWGERYFHVRGPDGHELSFARPLDRGAEPSAPAS